MVILKVGLLREAPVLCTSGKTYQLSSFSFKNFTLYIYSPVHTRKTSRTSPRVSEPHCDSDLVSGLHTLSLALDIALLDFALPHSLTLSHALTSLSHAFTLPRFALALPRFCALSHFALRFAHRNRYRAPRAL
jgi:hypothetical protein